MEISYNKLWKLLIDKGMNKTDLRTKAHLSSGTMAKLGKNENVTTDILVLFQNVTQLILWSFSRLENNVSI